MSITKRAIFIVVIALMVLFSTSFFLIASFIAKGFGDVEEQWAKDNIIRVQEAYKAMESALLSKSADWAVWSDMYQFVQDRNDAFIKSNLGDVSFGSLQVDIMYFLNDKNEEVFGKYFDKDEQKEKTFESDFRKIFQNNSRLTEYSDIDDVHSGIITYQAQPFLFVSRPVLTSEHEGPARGTLVFMRAFDMGEVQKLSDTVKFNIQFKSPSDPQIPSAVKEHLIKASFFVQLKDDLVLTGYLKVSDFFGNTSGVFVITMERQIHQQALRTIRTIASFLLVAGMILIVLLAFLLQRLFLKRISRLSEDISQLTRQQQLQHVTIRLNEEGRDEFSAVAKVINGLLSAIDQSNKKIKENDLILREKEQEILAEQQKRLEELGAINKQILQKTKDLEKMHAANLNIMEDLQISRQEAELASRAKSQFLANMSHEIRTPLNAVLGFSNLLNNSSLDEEQRKYLTTVTSSGELLLSIINDILDISKIEAGHLQLETIDFNMTDLVEGTFNIVKEKVSGKPVVLQHDIRPDVSGWFKGDPTRIRQVIVNLLSNAAKFTKEGHIRLTIEREPLRDKEGKLGLRFKVSDTGIGIASDKLKSIFEPFTQEDSSTTRKFGGTGLGLTICRNLVEKMGGEILVESVQGKGSDFIFTIRLSPGQEQAKVEEKVIVDSVDLKQVRILVVDDSIPNQQLIKAFFGMFGCQGVYANNGQEAVDILRHDKNFNLCLMDMQMPVLGGIDATRIIRYEITKDIPIIALTAAALKEDQVLAFEAGMNDFLTKPIEMSKLKATIVQYVQK